MATALGFPREDLKETNIAEWMERVGRARCLRCGGLKISMPMAAGVMIVAREGNLAGPWVKELELSWRSAAGTQPIYPVRVELSSVTFNDADREE